MIKSYSKILLLCMILGSCNTLLSARRFQPSEPAKEEVITEDVLWKSIDSDDKEFLAHFGKFVQGWVQMIYGNQQKDVDPKMLTDGIHQTIGSFIDMLLTGMKKSHIKAIKNQKDAQKVIQWIIKEYSKPMHAIVKREIIKSRQASLLEKN
jgi:hypothetical protein